MMRVVVWITMMLLLGCAVPGLCAAIDDKWEPRVHKNGDDSLPYRLFKPAQIAAETQYPLILFLHGAPRRGTDNQRQVAANYSPVATWLQPKWQEQYPCFIVAPQCKPNDNWGTSPWEKFPYKMKEQPTTSLRLAIDIVDAIKGEFPVDPNKVYVVGNSMGGVGSWEVIMRWPEKIAAALIMCGNGDVQFASKVTEVAIWSWHGSKDPTIPVKGSQALNTAIKEAGGNIRYTELPVGHDVWSSTMRNPETVPWLFAQRKGAKPAPVEATTPSTD